MKRRAIIALVISFLIVLTYYPGNYTVSEEIVAIITFFVIFFMILSIPAGLLAFRSLVWDLTDRSYLNDLSRREKKDTQAKVKADHSAENTAKKSNVQHQISEPQPRKEIIEKKEEKTCMEVPVPQVNEGYDKDRREKIRKEGGTESNMSEVKKFCPYCGKRLIADSRMKFCPYCGESLCSEVKPVREDNYGLQAEKRSSSQGSVPPITGNFYQHTWDCECAFNKQGRSLEPCCYCSNRKLGEGSCTDSATRY